MRQNPLTGTTGPALWCGYALPASGGAGVLTTLAFGTYSRTADYALYANRAPVWQLVVVHADDGAVWPQGMLAPNQAPAVTGADLINVLFNDQYYAAVVSGNGNLKAVWNGVTRTVTLPDALPAPLPLPGDLYSAPAMNFAQSLHARAECGAFSQTVPLQATLGNTCWNWVGDDGIQAFFFARLTPANGFPPLFGMGQFNATGFVVAPPSDPELVFHDMLLGRSVRLPLVGNQIFGYLPMGIYRVETADGIWLQDYQNQIAEFTVDSYFPPPIALILLDN